MTDFSVIQQGNIYFIYRPKIQHSYAENLEDVQRFFMVLKPGNENKYIIMVVGRKRLPESSPYFIFVEKIFTKEEDLIHFFQPEEYDSPSPDERSLSAAQEVAEGKYLLINHTQHTHLCYQVSSPSVLHPLQQQFHLKKQADYLINVKNPHKPSPAGVGLESAQKASYPITLQDKFGDYRFIPVLSAAFLGFEGAEFLLIGKDHSDLQRDELKECFHQILPDKLTPHFEKVTHPDGSIVKALKG